MSTNDIPATVASDVSESYHPVECYGDKHSQYGDRQCERRMINAICRARQSQCASCLSGSCHRGACSHLLPEQMADGSDQSERRVEQCMHFTNRNMTCARVIHPQKSEERWPTSSTLKEPSPFSHSDSPNSTREATPSDLSRDRCGYTSRTNNEGEQRACVTSLSCRLQLEYRFGSESRGWCQRDPGACKTCPKYARRRNMTPMCQRQRINGVCPAMRFRQS